MESSPLHERLHTAAGKRTFKALSQLTDTHPETVRRYMSGQSPSIEFITQFCSALGICADWLCSGRGPMRLSDQLRHALGEAGPSDLLTAMSGCVDRMNDRIDRLERYVQILETHLRADTEPTTLAEVKPVPAPDAASSDSATRGPSADMVTDGESSASPDAGRARKLAQSLTRRPRPDAG